MKYNSACSLPLSEAPGHVWKCGKQCVVVVINGHMMAFWRSCLYSIIHFNSVDALLLDRSSTYEQRWPTCSNVLRQRQGKFLARQRLHGNMFLKLMLIRFRSIPCCSVRSDTKSYRREVTMNVTLVISIISTLADNYLIYEYMVMRCIRIDFLLSFFFTRNLYEGTSFR